MSARSTIKNPGLMLGASLVAMALSVRAQAQDAAPAASVEEVVVTGARIATLGTTSPTLLTVVSTQELPQTTPPNIPRSASRPVSKRASF